MMILTEENEAVPLAGLPERICDTRHYCIMRDEDFQFAPLIFVECYQARAIKLTFGRFSVKIPDDFQILAYDSDCGIIEAVDSLRGGFEAFSFNPLSGLLPSAPDYRASRSLEKVEWLVPKMPTDCALAVSVGPHVIYITRSKTMSEINLSDLL